jgi:hypothetical protein
MVWLVYVINIFSFVIDERAEEKLMVFGLHWTDLAPDRKLAVVGNIPGLGEWNVGEAKSAVEFQGLFVSYLLLI